MPSLLDSPTSTEPPSAADDAVVASFRIFHQHCPRREGFNSPSFMPDTSEPEGQYVGLACEACGERVYVVLLPLT